MDDEIHALTVHIDGFDKPLKLHGGFEGYDDPYKALAEYGFFKGPLSGELQVGEARIHIKFETQLSREG
jgi:hypothetical protein